MEIISTTALISINGTLLAQVVSFLIFMLIINRIMVRPLQDQMAEREDHIEKIKLDIEGAEKEMEQFSVQIEERKSQVIAEALEITKELESSGNETANQLIASAREEITTLKEAADRDVDAKMTEAKKHIQDKIL